MKPILADVDYFVYNMRTFGNESFHSLCNRYYDKGSVVSFPVFQMKRQFACLDWNEQKRRKAQNQEDLKIQNWQVKLLKRLTKALKA